MSGDDSDIANVWEEICVQVQFQESVVWQAYETTARSVLAAHVNALSSIELQTAWLDTDRGLDWLFDDDLGEESAPVVIDDLFDHLLQELLTRAANWSNRRIRSALERSSQFD